jgi:putative glycosyltransferase (TIGR04372 family)
MFLDRIIGYLNEHSPILIQTPWMGAIGNCAEEVYSGLLKARRERKRVCFLFPKDTCGWFRFSRKKLNTELTHIRSSFRFLNDHHVLVFVGEWVVSLIYYGFRLLSHLLTISSRLIGRRLRFREDYMIPSLGQQHLWWPEGAAEFNRALVQRFDWEAQLATYLPVELPPSHVERAEQIRGQLGLPLDDWFVCLHVREGSLYNDHVEAYLRNADIRSYFKAVREITARGGWVVRLGDPTMTRLPEMERVIDYAHSRYKSDLMDIYLIKQCSVYIGSQSGIWDVAALFQKPLLMPNMCEWSFVYPQRYGDLGILKHVFSKTKNRFLSIQEMLALSGRCQYIFTLDDDFVLYENSADEILWLVQEYYKNKDNNTQEVSFLQKEFNARRIYETYKVLEGEKIWSRNYDDVYNKFRVASRLEGCTGAIGDRFLSDNWEISSRCVESASVLSYKFRNSFEALRMKSAESVLRKTSDLTS